MKEKTMKIEIEMTEALAASMFCQKAREVQTLASYLNQYGAGGGLVDDGFGMVRGGRGDFNKLGETLVNFEKAYQEMLDLHKMRLTVMEGTKAKKATAATTTAAAAAAPVAQAMAVQPRRAR